MLKCGDCVKFREGCDGYAKETDRGCLLYYPTRKKQSELANRVVEELNKRQFSEDQSYINLNLSIEEAYLISYCMDKIIHKYEKKIKQPITVESDIEEVIR